MFMFTMLISKQRANDFINIFQQLIFYVVNVTTKRMLLFLQQCYK